MSRYVIGDLHGCYSSLNRLLEKINYNVHKDELWFVGDIINRGSDSLKTIQWVMNLEKKGKVKVVLGNHDFLLLAIASGFNKFNTSTDTLQEIVEHKDFKRIVNWLRKQKLVYVSDKELMVHAGIPPIWDVETALYWANEIESEIQGDNWQKIIAKHIFGNQPKIWHKCRNRYDKLRYAVNAFTRMRFLYLPKKYTKCEATINNTNFNMQNYALDFKQKGNLLTTEEKYIPWFKLNQHLQNYRVFFGHWSRIGGTIENNCYALDTNCIWNEHLSAFCLDNNEWIKIECQEENSFVSKVKKQTKRHLEKYYLKKDED